MNTAIGVMYRDASNYKIHRRNREQRRAAERDARRKATSTQRRSQP